MNKTDLTTAVGRTSFLYGGNAQFIEQLYVKFLDNPSTVDPAWRQFFLSLEDQGENTRQGKGPSWRRSAWPPAENGEFVSAFDGNWPAAPIPSKTPAKAKDRAAGP